MAIIRKNKTSVGSSLPRNPRDKDLAVNSITGEVKVYNQTSNAWSLVGDGTGVAIPDVLGNEGKYLSLNTSENLVWSDIPTPTASFVGYELLSIASNVGYEGVSKTFNFETAVAELVGVNVDGAFNGKHFLFEPQTAGSSIDIVSFTGGLIGAVNPYLNADFRVTVIDGGMSDAFISGGANLTVRKSTSNTSFSSYGFTKTINFKHHFSDGAHYLYAW
jgi:hypothetical protein